MPGQFRGAGRVQESFIPTASAPAEHQALRIQCSPNKVGTFGHYVMHVSKPTLSPFMSSMDTAVIVLPGGGGMHLAWEVEGSSVARMFERQGISAFILKYRVPAADWGDEALLADVQRALSYVRSRYNMKHVGVFGGSFGGKLAIMASTTAVRVYGAIDDVDRSSFKPDFAVLLYPALPSEAYLQNMRNAPPTLISVSRDDPCTRLESVQSYVDGAAQAGLGDSFKLRVYPQGTHGYGTCEYYSFLADQKECRWPGNAKRFIDEQTAGGRPAASYWGRPSASHRHPWAR